MVPAEKDHIARLVRREEADILQDLGGPENVSAMERGIISDLGMALGLILLAYEEAATRGSIAVAADGKTWDLMPGMGRIKGLLDTRRQNLLALGLTRRAKDADRDTILLKDFSTPRPANGGNGTEGESAS